MKGKRRVLRHEISQPDVAPDASSRCRVPGFGADIIYLSCLMRRPLLMVSVVWLGAGLIAVAGGACVGDDPAVDGGASAEASVVGEAAAPDGAGDAADGGAGRRCDPSAPFGGLEVIDDLATPENQPEAWLSGDELTVYLARGRPEAGVDLYSATRLTLTARFGAPTPLATVNSDADDDNPTMTGDGLHLFFHSARGEDGGTRATRLFVASRQFTVQPFSPPVLVGGIPVLAVNQLDPFISSDGDRLYLGQDFADAATLDQDIYMAVRESGTTFKTPVAIAELNTTSFETQPILTADETVVYFTSNRDGGNFDIWRAHRADRTAKFSVPERVPVASSTLIDTPTWVSHDDCELWIARGEFPAKRDLLRLRRPAP